MLIHNQLRDNAPADQRIVVIGGNSFVGKALTSKLLEIGYKVYTITRASVDLTSPDAGDQLARHLHPSDVVVAVAAVAPCRNTEDFVSNALIVDAYTKALTLCPVAYVLNISSDAVYPDEPTPLNEAVHAAPTSMHGVMHLFREIAFGGLGIPLGVLRPTLIYGASDPHNGYGPNQFRRLANSGRAISLFGKGEERRDHVYIDDVVTLATGIISRRSVGVLNAATGSVTSFAEIARLAIKFANSSVSIENKPRSGPMPHKGYRPFSPAETLEAFPGFRYMDIEVGMKAAQALAETSRGEEG